jgi:hypothetical protein
MMPPTPLIAVPEVTPTPAEIVPEKTLWGWPR